MKNILLLALLFRFGQVNAQLCFSSATNFPTDTVISVTSSDFNNDGKIDLATANYSSNTISILLGTGTGSFNSPINFLAGFYPLSIVSADFNGDGKADLAVANYGSNDISVLLGTGTGNFSAATNFTVGVYPVSVCNGDFNNDGKTDLSVANYGSDSVSILLGTGTGSFGAITNFAVGVNPYSVCSTDFNGDSKADLAISNQSTNDVSILLGTGTGSFSAPTNFMVGTFPRSITTGDFNGDSKIDLAVANSGSNDVSILLGIGNGSFGTATSFTTGGGQSVVAKDFNSDTKIDLAIAMGGSSNFVSVLLGTGSGIFGSVTNFTVAYNPVSVYSDDFNGDGKADLTTTNSLSSNLSIALNCTPTPTCIASVTDSLYNISPLNWGILANYSPQVTSAKWSWGDGTTTTGLYPSHTYTTAGWYSICATVYTSCGDSATACRNDSIYRYANNNSMVNVYVVSTTTGINQVINTNQISIYPNPANEIINIALQQAQDGNTEIKITNLLGEQITLSAFGIFRPGGEKTIDVSVLQNGIYFVSVKTNEGLCIKKIVVQH